MKRGTVRMRLSLLYGGLFLLTTMVVLIPAGFLLERSLDASAERFVERANRSGLDPAAAGQGGSTTQIKVHMGGSVLGSQQIFTWATIAVLGVLAFAASWWLAGRVLRPLHRITDTARRLTLSNLDERIALTGPQDELKDLADTFDDMLDRLARATDSQRRFVANASHELRTPLAIQRAAIEIGLADAEEPAKVARMCTEMLQANERSERLIEGLLTLAQSERGLDARLPIALDAVVEQVAEQHQTEGITLDLDVHPVTVAGDEVLLTQLVANLVQNAVRYNHPGGHVTVRLSPDTGLTIRNTGSPVPADQVSEIFEPFRRLHPDRTGSAGGAGLGLSIVAAIAHAHDAAVTAEANPEGGLTITVALPALAPLPAKGAEAGRATV
ncbi:MAG: sensor histidine kinase [Actinomycetia bacterium]|nr:sensor histidine kinase [Actinomycetes bacterium]